MTRSIRYGLCLSGLALLLALPGCYSGTPDKSRQAKTDGKDEHDPGETGSDGVKDPKEKAVNLALTPGGVYTEKDITDNGNTTPAEKFKGKNFKHSKDELKPGDKICPITESKANPDCCWIIQGQRYEFCCLPCVDQFIRRARNNPAKVKNADEYVYKK